MNESNNTPGIPAEDAAKINAIWNEAVADVTSHETSVDDAAKMTGLWREAVADTGKQNDLTKQLQDLRAFNIPYSDLVGLLSVKDATNFRAYMACSIDQTVDDPAHSPFKLVIVATDKEDNDILERVFDFTNPCPGSCGTNPSILLNGQFGKSAQ